MILLYDYISNISIFWSLILQINCNINEIFILDCIGEGVLSFKNSCPILLFSNNEICSNHRVYKRKRRVVEERSCFLLLIYKSNVLFKMNYNEKDANNKSICDVFQKEYIPCRIHLFSYLL